MKSILVALLVLVFSVPVLAAKWEPTREQVIELYKLLAHEVNREKVFNEFKRVIDQGMSTTFVDMDGETMPHWFATVSFHRWEGDEEQRPVSFTEWDKKLLKLVVRNGGDLNRIFLTSGNDQYTVLHKAIENHNFELAKEMVALGANHLASFSEHSFNFEHNVLTYTMYFGVYDLEAFEYFFNLGGWVPNTPALCSAGYGAGTVGSDGGEELRRLKILKILKAAGNDQKTCRIVLGMGI